MARLLSYARLLKLKQTFLLVFSGLAPLFIGLRGSVELSLVATYVAGLSLAVAGTTAVNMYFDRDIDAAMRRTAGRPLPTREIDPPWKAIALGLALFGLGEVVSLRLGILTAAIVGLGFAFDIFVYTLATKRRTPWSVIFGGVAGAAPALAGWTAATGELGLEGILLAALVLLWIPEHIWTLATYYADDYAKAGVPMLPVVWGAKKSARATLAFSLGAAAVAICLGWVARLGAVYEAVAVLASAILVWNTLAFARDPSPERAMKTFKVANAYLGIVLLAALLSSLT